MEESQKNCKALIRKTKKSILEMFLFSDKEIERLHRQYWKSICNAVQKSREMADIQIIDGIVYQNKKPIDAQEQQKRFLLAVASMATCGTGNIPR